MSRFSDHSPGSNLGSDNQFPIFESWYVDRGQCSVGFLCPGQDVTYLLEPLVTASTPLVIEVSHWMAVSLILHC